MFSIPLDERETIINFGRTEKGCWIYTSDETVMTRLDKLVASSPHYELKKIGNVKGSPVDREYYLDDKTLISFRSEKKKMSEEQKQAAAERMRNLKNKPVS